MGQCEKIISLTRTWGQSERTHVVKLSSVHMYLGLASTTPKAKIKNNNFIKEFCTGMIFFGQGIRQNVNHVIKLHELKKKKLYNNVVTCQPCPYYLLVLLWDLNVRVRSVMNTYSLLICWYLLSHCTFYGH